MNKLEKYLKGNCITQRGFAKKVGTSSNYLGLLVRGKSIPSLPLAYEIEKKTGGKVKVYDWLPPAAFENYEEID